MKRLAGAPLSIELGPRTMKPKVAPELVQADGPSFEVKLDRTLEGYLG